MPTEPTLDLDIPRTGLPAPQAVNFFHFVVSGPEVELLVGFMDLQAIHEAKQRKSGRGVLIPEVTHRLVMSQRGLALLRRQVDDITKKYEAIAEERVKNAT